MQQKVCRRCLIQEMGDEEYQNMIKKHVDVLHAKDRTDDATYEERLSVCKTCEKLNAGTCLSCGCYVEIRAAFIHGRCPNKKW